jgi:hypothetical protein
MTAQNIQIADEKEKIFKKTLLQYTPDTQLLYVVKKPLPDYTEKNG